MANRLIKTVISLVLLALSAPLIAQTTFTFTLTPEQEVPPTGSSASGVAFLELNAAGTALTYNIQLTGLDLDGAQTPDAGDDITGMHFHNAPAGVNGGLVFGLIGPGHDADDIVINPVAGTITGAWEETDAGGSSLSSQLTNLLAGELYINVHTVNSPPGEIRGQVVETRPATPVPAFGLPGAWVLLLLLAGFGAVMLRKPVVRERQM